MGYLGGLSDLCQFVWYLWLTGVSARVGWLRMASLAHLLLADWLIWGVSAVMAHFCSTWSLILQQAVLNFFILWSLDPKEQQKRIRPILKNRWDSACITFVNVLLSEQITWPKLDSRGGKMDSTSWMWKSCQIFWQFCNLPQLGLWGPIHFFIDLR